jgi:hypothetical protein
MKPTVFKNYRVFGDPAKPMKFRTENKCTNCGKSSPNYIQLTRNLLCKGCLNEFINMLNEDFQEEIKNSARG